jgi:hypothetical protein
MQISPSLNLNHVMVIIWRGLGFLVPVIVFGCSLAANLIFNVVCGEGYYDNHKWSVAASLISQPASAGFSVTTSATDQIEL